MEGLSWGQILLTVISSMAAVWLAAYLKAKQVSFKKIYGLCIGFCSLLPYIFFLIRPRKQMNPDICWISLGEYCIPSLWVLLAGFAFGNYIYFFLWLYIRRKN